MDRFRIGSDGWLEIGGKAAPRRETPNMGGRMAPDLVVLHDTAGHLSIDGTVAWFADPASKVSAHFVVGRDGAVVQMAPCDRQCWHAGKSEWRGRKYCNGFAVGIEMVNPGLLTERGTGAVAWFGEVYDAKVYEIERRRTDQHGDGMWMPYTDRQLATVDAIVAALAEAYPAIGEVVGHYQISPGRKVDPNPLLPPRMLGAVSGMSPAPSRDADPDMVHMAQERLASLGYFPGTADGVVGPRTETAVFAFQRQNDIDGTGRLDPRTLARLMSSEAVCMPSGARESVTEADLAPTSRTVAEQQDARLDARITTALGIATTITTAMTGLGSSLKQLVDTIGIEALIAAAGGGLAAFGIRQWRRADRTIGYRVDDARSGVHAGNGGTS